MNTVSGEEKKERREKEREERKEKDREEKIPKSNYGICIDRSDCTIRTNDGI